MITGIRMLKIFRMRQSNKTKLSNCVRKSSSIVLQELGDVKSVVEFANILNYKSPLDASIDSKNIAGNLPQSLCDEISDRAAVSSECNASEAVPSS